MAVNFASARLTTHARLHTSTRCKTSKSQNRMIKLTVGDARDVPAIMPVMDAAFDPAYGEGWTAAQALGALTLPNTQCIIASMDDDQTVAGFAMTRWVLDEEELLMIGVLPEKQGKGIASHIIEYITGNARAHGRCKLFLEVRDGNKARSFYEYMGFSESGRRKSYYRGSDGTQYDAVTMSLSLKDEITA